MKISRAAKRFGLRKKAFKELSEIYPGEPRKVRRSMAADLSKNWYRSGKVSVGE